MRLDGLRILVLEDEPFIAIDIEETLTAAGAQSVMSFESGVDAEYWLVSNIPDLAIVDPRLKDGFCLGVAALLVQQGVPFLVHSGDLQSMLGAGSPFQRGKWVSKPCTPHEMLEAADTLLRQ